MVPSSQQRDLVGQQHGRRPVRDDDAGHRVQHPAQRLLDDGLGVHVERGQGVVEHEDLRARRGSRAPATAAAAARRTGSCPARRCGCRGRTAGRRRTARRRRRWPVPAARPSHPGRPSRRFSATDIENSVGSSNAVATVCRSAAGDSSRMSLSVDADLALGDVVQPRQQRGQHRLARTRRADQRERLTRLDGDGDVPQCPVVGCRVWEAEADVDQFEPPAARCSANADRR